MAKEFAGVLLVMAAILRSESGQSHLRSARKKNFRHPWQIKDWILLVETLLQWESYLTLARMEKRQVRRLKKKHRFLMYLLKKVGNRVKGMGFKVMKFHAILHLAFDILMFAVPLNVDTGSNESHHKTTKVAAKLTQKDIKSFEKQTSNRCDDFHVLDLAMQEIEGRPLWHYFNGYEHRKQAVKPRFNTTGGMKMVVYEDATTHDVKFKVITRMKNPQKVKVEDDLLHFVMQIQKDLADVMPKIPICAEHCRGDQIFRSHPHYLGKGPWRDWVMVRWTTGELPSKIWGFLDLSSLPEHTEFQLTVGDYTVEKGIFAIIESADVMEVDADSITSDLFTEIKLETKELDDHGELVHRQ
ncbi:MAG: hypothetical protein ACRCYM_00635, partial [Cetobacterium sp.]